jgi:hypothetical protein
VPGEIAGIGLAEHADLHLLLDVPVIGRGRMAIEHKAAGGPDIDEVGGHTKAVAFDNPAMAVIEREERDLQDREDGAHHHQRRWNRAAIRGRQM